VRKFIGLWFLTMIRPREASNHLLEAPAPKWGLYATPIRFAGTAITSILALHLLNRHPFVPPYITFLDEAEYYGPEVFFLLLFGIAVWLLSSDL
jgi:hypothetical protein